jgi:DNA-binding response OmpR family regulator
MEGKAKILCVEDDPDTCEMVTLSLSPLGYEVIPAHTIAAALRRAAAGDLRAYLIDGWLPDGAGIELCRKLREFDPHTPIIFYSGEAFPREIEEAMQAGTQAYLVKPVDPEELERTLAALLGKESR